LKDTEKEISSGDSNDQNTDQNISSICKAEQKEQNLDDRISKTDRWKGYLDERKLYIECYFKISQDFDKVLIAWPAGALGVSLTILWHISGAVSALWSLILCWITLGLSLGMMLLSMLASQEAFKKAIDTHDENYKRKLQNLERLEDTNPWNGETEEREKNAMLLLAAGVVFLFIFAIANAPGMKLNNSLDHATKTLDKLPAKPRKEAAMTEDKQHLQSGNEKPVERYTSAPRSSVDPDRNKTQAPRASIDPDSVKPVEAQPAQSTEANTQTQTDNQQKEP